MQEIINSLTQNLDRIDDFCQNSDTNQDDFKQQQRKSYLKIFNVESICYCTDDSRNTVTKLKIKDEETKINIGATGLSAFLSLINGLKVRIVWKWNTLYAIAVTAKYILLKFIQKPIVFKFIMIGKKKKWDKQNVNEHNLITFIEYPKIMINVNDSDKMTNLKNMINDADQIYEEQIISKNDWTKLTFKFCKKEAEFVTNLINKYRAPYLQDHKQLKKTIDTKLKHLHRKKRECLVCSEKIYWFSYHPLCLQEEDNSLNCANLLTSKIFNDKISYLFIALMDL